MRIKGWLTRRSESYFIITKKPAIVKKVDGTDRIDAWATPGDRLTLNYLCDYIVALLPQAAQMKVGESKRVKMDIDWDE